jgi:hypothetical protein
MLTRIFLVLILSLFLCSCNDTGVRNKVSNLDESIKQYNIALRWAMHENLDGYHVTRDGERKKINRKSLENIRITGFDFSEKELNDEATEATVNGEIKYYRTDVGTLKSLSYEQIWWYDEDLKRWFMESDFPVFN